MWCGWSFSVWMFSSQLLQIVHNVSRALDVDSRLARLEERSRHVQINDESLCDSCFARLGTKLFAMYPDDTIVCYKVSLQPSISLAIMHASFPLRLLFLFTVLPTPGWIKVSNGPWLQARCSDKTRLVSEPVAEALVFRKWPLISHKHREACTVQILKNNIRRYEFM